MREIRQSGSVGGGGREASSYPKRMKPVALALNLTPVTNTPGPTYARDIANRIRNHHAGQTVLVVGHTNTTRDVIAALGVANPPTIQDDEFDNLFIVTLAQGSDPKLIALKYGD